MIAYIEDNVVDFERISRTIPDVKRFVRLKDFLDSEEQFDLIICDLSLPDAYGPEILEEMTGRNVVILTGLASMDFSEAKKAIEEKGFQHVLSKDDPNIINYIKNLIPE